MKSDQIRALRYGGRPAHLHIRVTAAGHTTLVTQHYPAEGQSTQTFDLVLRPARYTGCQKFAARFGLEALRGLSMPVGKALQLRGINATGVQPGVIRVGDVAKKL